MLDPVTAATALRRLVLIGAILLAAWPAAARDAPGPVAAQDPSGWYGEMMLSVRGNQVEGVFATARGIDLNGGSGPMFSCYFLLQGHLVRGRADIVSWTPGDMTVIKGSLTLAASEARLRLRSDQPGCGMAAGDMTREDYVLTRVSPAPDWIGVGLVGARRAMLRATPSDTGPPAHPGRAPYLVRYDAVAVLQRRAGWARVRCVGGETPSTGWLRQTELAPFTSWPTREDEP